MNEAGNAATAPSVGELVGSLVTETGSLVRQEMSLASTEFGHKAKEAALEVGVICVGGALANAGLLLVALSVVIGAAAFVPMWASALALGVVAAVVGFVMIRRGLKALRNLDLVPRRTVETLHVGTGSMKEQYR